MFHTELARYWDDLRDRRGLMNKLKYARHPINLWTRTPRYLLQAMERAIAGGEVSADKLELVLVGELSAADRALVEKSAVAGGVEMFGFKGDAWSVVGVGLAG